MLPTAQDQEKMKGKLSISNCFSALALPGNSCRFEQLHKFKSPKREIHPIIILFIQFLVLYPQSNEIAEMVMKLKKSKTLINLGLMTLKKPIQFKVIEKMSPFPSEIIQILSFQNSTAQWTNQQVYEVQQPSLLKGRRPAPIVDKWMKKKAPTGLQQRCLLCMQASLRIGHRSYWVMPTDRSQVSFKIANMID